jgi:hypothetical protein
MIFPLRQRHRHMFALLGAALPVVFIVGVAARKPVPLRVAPQLSAAMRAAETEVWKRNDVFSKIPVSMRLLRGPASSFYAIEFLPEKGFAKPDLLVYWVIGQLASSSDALPDSAVLLGPFAASKSFQLPQSARIEGAVVLYGLADNEIVDWSKPISIGERKP